MAGAAVKGTAGIEVGIGTAAPATTAATIIVHTMVMACRSPSLAPISTMITAGAVATIGGGEMIGGND